MCKFFQNYGIMDFGEFLSRFKWGIAWKICENAFVWEKLIVGWKRGNMTEIRATCVQIMVGGRCERNHGK